MLLYDKECLRASSHFIPTPGLKFSSYPKARETETQGAGCSPNPDHIVDELRFSVLVEECSAVIMSQ